MMPTSKSLLLFRKCNDFMHSHKLCKFCLVDDVDARTSYSGQILAVYEDGRLHGRLQRI